MNEVAFLEHLRHNGGEELAEAGRSIIAAMRGARGVALSWGEGPRGRCRVSVDDARDLTLFWLDIDGGIRVEFRGASPEHAATGPEHIWRTACAARPAAGRGSDVVASAVLENPDAVCHKPVELAALEAWVAVAPDGAEAFAAARAKRLLVEIDLAVLRAHPAEETGEPVGDDDVRQWLHDTGFAPLGERWPVTEPDLGQLDPSEVRAVGDARQGTRTVRSSGLRPSLKLGLARR